MSLSPATLARLVACALAAAALAACPDPPDEDDGRDRPDGHGDVDASGPVACSADGDCAALAGDPCTTPVCDTAAGFCALSPRPDGTPCATGGLCRIQETCQAGVCQGGRAAPPKCAGKDCGQDACGNVCGTCPADQICASDATCKPKPQCGAVGYDGCCTAAGSVLFCAEDGQLAELACAAGTEFPACGWNPAEGYYDCMAEARPEPSGALPWLCPGESCEAPCAGRECGFRCGVACGDCSEGEFCTAAGQCQACSCVGRQCGDDGCGQSCGSCAAGQACGADGLCVDQACGGVPYEGCCDLTVLTWCDGDGQLQTFDCGAAGCGWNPEIPGYYDCGHQGADPSGQFPIGCDPVVQPDPGPEAVEPGPEPVEAVEAVEAVEPGPDAGATEVIEEIADDASVDTTPDADDDLGPDAADVTQADSAAPDAAADDATD